LELDVIGLAKAPVVRGIGLEDGMLAELGAIAHMIKIPAAAPTQVVFQASETWNTA
jgi:hypothetical protein